MKALAARYAQVARAAWQHRHELAGPARLADERAFLPAHLSLQDTPPHPAPRRTALAICALFTITLAWSVLGQLDIMAVAPGRILVNRHSKTVQPLEASVVRAIHVADGDIVQAGQLLIELDPTAPEADDTRLRQEQASALSELLRCQALLGSVSSPTPGKTNTPRLAEAPSAGASLSTPQRAAAQAQLHSEWADIQAHQAKLQAELQRRQAEQHTAEQQATKLRLTLPLAQQREADFAALQAQGFIAGHASQDRSRERLEIERDLATAQARWVEAGAAIAESLRNAQAYQAETLRSLRERLAQAQLKLASLAPERSKTEQRQRLTLLRAPVSGTVQQLSIHTAGGVVTPAQALLVVVPGEAQVNAEVQLENKDIGFVHPGQIARIKLDTFPFTRYGTVEATVQTVSADAVVDAQKGTATYAVTLRLAQTTLDVDGRAIKLSPGMNLSAEIRTGQRRVIEYLLNPIQKMGSEGLRER